MSAKKKGDAKEPGQIERLVEEWIETGRRPRRARGEPRLSYEFEDQYAREARAASASIEESEGRRRAEMLCYLRKAGFNEIADDYEEMWNELQMYRRLVEKRNLRGDVTRSKRSKSLETYNAARPTTMKAKRLMAAYGSYLRMGQSPTEARRLVQKNYGGDYTPRHINRLLAEAEAEMKRSSGRK